MLFLIGSVSKKISQAVSVRGLWHAPHPFICSFVNSVLSIIGHRFTGFFFCSAVHEI